MLCRYDRRSDIKTGRLHDFEAGLPEGFREKLPEDYDHWTKRELDRIAELRALFAGKTRNLPDIVELKKLKIARKENSINSRHANLNLNEVWKDKLKKEQAELQRDCEAFGNKPAKATQVRKDLETNGQKIRGAKNKDRILNKMVAKWESPGDLIAEVEQDVPDDSGHGIGSIKKPGFLRKADINRPENSDVPAPSGGSKQLTGIRRIFLPNAKVIEDKNGPRKGPTPFSMCLRQAAKVYEAMDLEPDIKLVHSQLHESPPFHPLRTLDQSYYFKLENTESWDRDQVVYRATNERTNMHGSSRVVMVDQLWMYILDERGLPFWNSILSLLQDYIIDNHISDTIIISFPKRLGRNKPDSSAVNKCIRNRLEKIRQSKINSVYDLALLVINECSVVFFDHTKPTDERPEVLDTFTNAISYVSGMKTTAFELF
ncbi:uncharacterized protein EAF01_007071 [Botrytis porri]|uniref:uncharacterized protein n=1 Tax=Botrytis porri TaxID=87229 RepID=UPI001901BAE3|nr:uncharacterized protein EAF01_007071 [Botrytis porri]KAF7901772.1 hypothetical protein EAF01_007071 [Botrytis porri]